MSETSGGQRRLLNATAVMASGTAISRVLGLVRAILIAFILGNGTLRADVFTLALTVPNSLYLLLAGGTLNNVLVPQIVRAVNHDPDGGKAYVDRIMTGFLLVLGTLTVLFTVATPLVMSLYTTSVWRTPDMAEHWGALLLMSYITMPQIFFYGVFFLIGQVLNAKEKFGPMMWAPILNNVISIITLGSYLVMWGSQVGTGGTFTAEQVWLLAIGSSLGIISQTLVLLPFLKQVGFRYRPRFDLKGTGLGRTFHIAKWMIGYVALTSLAQVVVTNLASSAAPAGSGGGGGINVYQNAYLIWILPHSLLTVSLATAMLPAASRMAVAGDRSGVAAETGRALRLALTFIVPTSLAFLALAGPITRIPFGNGAGAEDYHFVAWALAAFGIGLVPYTLQYLQLRAFYALDNTRTPFLLQIWISGANAALAIGLVMAWNHPPSVAARLALAYSLSYFLGAFATHRALRGRLPDLSGHQVITHVGRLLVASLPAVVLAWLITWWFSGQPSPWLRLIGLALAGLAAVLVFFFAAKRLGIPETTALLDLLRRRRGGDGESDAVEAIVDEIDLEADQGASRGSLESDVDPEGEDSLPVTPTVGSGRLRYLPDNPAPFPEVPPVPDSAVAEPADAEIGHGVVGQILADRYRLIQLLHPSGVWAAWDATLGRPVLIQLLDPWGSDTLARLAWAREWASAVDSRFLRVLDVTESGTADDVYLVFEYSAGQTLDALLGTGRLSGVETAWIIREAADALSGLHSQGLAHGDFAPDTVLITHSGQVKVLPPGLSGDFTTRVSADGEALDLRRLGATLYACLVHCWPDGNYPGLESAPTVGGRIAPASSVRTGVPPSLDRIADRLLSALPLGNASRITSAASLTTELSLVLGPVSAAAELGLRLNPEHTDPVAPVSLVAPPLPTPASSHFSESSALDDEDSLAHQELVAERSEGFTPVPPPAVSVPEPKPRQRVGKAPLLFGLLGVLVVTGLIAATLQQPAPGKALPTTSPVPLRVLPISKVTVFDPKADGGDAKENSDQVGLAVDGDPATIWSTERYRKLPNLGGLKPGVGLVLDLGDVQQIGQVRLTLPKGSTDLEVRVPVKPASKAPMKSQSQWQTVQGVAGVGGSVEIDLSAKDVASRFVLVYLTSLPKLKNGYFQGGIAEVEVLGR